VADSNYNSFPGFTIAANGDMVAAYRVGTNHTDGTLGVASIRCPYGSDPSVAANWSTPTTVVAADGYDYGTGVLTTLSDGRLAMTTWRRTSTGQVKTPDATRVLFSDDHGATWGPENVVESGWDGYTISESGLVEDTSGNLLLATWGRNNGDLASTGTAKVCRSTDGGATWAPLATIADGNANNKFYNESGLVRLADGRLAAIVREEFGQRLTISHSTDEGLTWTAPVTALDQHVAAPHPRRMDALGGLVYTLHREKLTGRARLIVTDGEAFQYATWVQTSGGAMMYGQVALLADGDLGVVWSRQDTATACPILFTRVSVT
jgi:hypothetical protein